MPIDESHLGLDGPEPGQRVGPWTLHARLGAGGTATVWRAEHDDGTVAALKLVDRHTMHHEDVQRLRHEVDAISALDHPHIVRALGHGTDARFAWLALELVEGEDLARRIERWQKAPDPTRFDAVTRIFTELADALQHLHDKGYVHRDVKPANVLLDADGHVKLTDFGVVTADDISRITMVGNLVGTIAFMAPELISEETIDARTDLYALGAILYSMCTLRRPIEADTVAGYLSRHLTTAPTPPHELDATVPWPLERVAMRLLEKDPARRYPSARAAVADLSEPDTTARPIFGREPLVEAWRDHLLDHEGGQGGLFLLEGPLGSGRSVLLRHLATIANDAGHAVVEGVDAVPAPDGVWVLDDLHDASIDTRKRLDDALAAGTLVLGATAPSPHVLAQAEHVVRLTPLDRPAIVKLLRERGVSSAAATALGQRLSGTELAWPGGVLRQLQSLQDEGWLRSDGTHLRHEVPLARLRQAPLPVGEATRTTLLERFGKLDDVAQELATMLAVLGRPADASFLARTASRPPRVPEAIETLGAADWIRTTATDGDHALDLAHPGAATAIVASLSEDTLRAHHQTIADALGRRRRRPSAELGHHLAAAGRPADALPVYVRAAQRAYKQGEHAVALRIVDEASAIEPAATVDLEAAEAARLSTALKLLQGSCQLALGRWLDAVPTLEAALSRARDTGEPAEAARVASYLGRGLYRLQRFDQASPILAAAVEDGTDGDPDIAAARRALADIHLQQGHLEGAMALMRDALDSARRTHSRDGEARAHRGIGHVLAMEGRFTEAATALEHADELLADGGDVRVRAGILLRTIELDTAAGRFAFALQRAMLLIDLLSNHHSATKLPEAHAYKAVLHRALGQRDEAVASARHALLMGKMQVSQSWRGVLGAVRTLDALDALDGSELAIVRSMQQLDDAVRQPRAQALALEARILARDDAAQAMERVWDVLEAEPAGWSLSQIARLTDVARACLRAQFPDHARAVLDGADALLDRDRALGARLELARLRADAGVLGAQATVERLVREIADTLPHRMRAAFHAQGLGA